MMGTSTPDQDVGRRRAEEDEETLTGSSSKKTPPKKTPVSDRWNHYTFKPVLAPSRPVDPLVGVGAEVVALGWETFNPAEVAREYPVRGGKVDNWLRGPMGAIVLIEVKRTGKELSEHQEQLLDYAFREGAPLAHSPTASSGGPTSQGMGGAGNIGERCSASRPEPPIFQCARHRTPQIAPDSGYSPLYRGASQLALDPAAKQRLALGSEASKQRFDSTRFHTEKLGGFGVGQHIVSQRASHELQ